MADSIKKSPEVAGWIDPPEIILYEPLSVNWVIPWMYLKKIFF